MRWPCSLVSVTGFWKEAKEYGCSNQLWLDLANVREKDHPDDSISIYQSVVESHIEHGNYDEAFDHLKKIRKLMLASNKGQEFNNYIQRVRTTWKRKRNMMKLLDQAGWH